MNKTHKKRSLPPLSALPAFEAAARHQSFTKAAEELNLTHGAISRAVAQIEGRLGVQLFVRRNRRVFLTSEGQRLFNTAEKVLDELSQTTEEMRRHQSDSPFLVVSCEPSLAMRWLMPRLGEFHRLHPELNVELRMAGGPIDLLASGCDLAIRRNDFGIPNDYQICHLVKEYAGPVCTESYWRSIGGALSEATLLHSRTRPKAWEDWSIKADFHLQHQNSQYFDHFFYALQAAQSNLGLAIGSQPIIADDLDSRRLIAPIGLEETGYDYAMLSLNRLSQDPRIEVFESWLRTQLVQS